jgi:hypothetical protein
MPGMKVKVDFDLCESNAVCMGILPEVFEVRDDDFLYILDEHPRRRCARSWRSASPPAPARPSRSKRTKGLASPPVHG